MLPNAKCSVPYTGLHVNAREVEPTRLPLSLGVPNNGSIGVTGFSYELGAITTMTEALSPVLPPSLLRMEKTPG